MSSLVRYAMAQEVRDSNLVEGNIFELKNINNMCVQSTAAPAIAIWRKYLQSTSLSMTIEGDQEEVVKKW